MLCFLWFHCFYHIAFAQNNFKSQEDLKKNAEKTFTAKDYVKATPLFSQLLSTVPKDANYNYKYGVCILYTNNDKGKCLKYLQFAAKNPKTTNDVYYYLGKAYHLNQRYDEAISAFNTFKKNASSGDIQKKGVDAEIQSINNARNHLGSNVNMVIVSKNQIPIASFTTAYDVSAMGGKIIDKPPIYRMKADKNDITNNTVYINNGLKVIYFSSYGIDGKAGKDIYKVTKNKKGEWSEPVNLGAPVNTGSDEDYPFISQDGKTLYFSSKGHNSIGGYDVFKSVYDSAKNTWSEPVSVGTPVNSPYDDLLFVVDSTGNANFASTRESSDGNIGFYKMIISERPIEFTTIKGSLRTDKTTDSKDATITILNYNDGSVVDVIKADELTGSYDMKLKPGRGYTIVVEKKGYIPHAENIYIPDQLVEHVLGQELRLSKSDSLEELSISNYFSILEENTDLNTAIKTEEITSDFKHAENYKEKLKTVAINDRTIDVTPPVNDISMQAKTLPVSAFAINTGANNISVDTSSPYSKGNVAGGTSNNETPAKKEEIKPDTSKQEIPNVITAKTTNNEIVTIAYSDAAAIQNEAKEMKKNAEIAESIGKARDSMAINLNKEIASLQKKIAVEKNVVIKKHLQDSIQQRQNEAAQLKEEANVAYSLSKEYNEDGSKLQKDADESLAIAKALENSSKTKADVNNQTAAKNNDNKRIEDTLYKKVEKINTNDLILKAAASFSELSKEKLMESDSVSLAANQLKTESVSLTNKANDTIKKATITPEPEKTRLRKKAAELERQSAQKQIESDQATTHARQLKDSAVKEEKKATIAKGLTNDIINSKEGITVISTPSTQTEKGFQSSEVNNETTKKTNTADTLVTTSIDNASKNDTTKITSTIKNKGNIPDIALPTQTKSNNNLNANTSSNGGIDKDNNASNGNNSININSNNRKDSLVANVVPNDTSINQSNASKAPTTIDSAAYKVKADTLYSQSKRLNDQSQQLYAKAKKSKNQKEKIKLMQQAQNLSDSSIEKQKQGDVASAIAPQIKTTEIPAVVVKNDTQTNTISNDTTTNNASIVIIKDTSTSPKKIDTASKEIKATADVSNHPLKEQGAIENKGNIDSARIIIPSTTKGNDVSKTSRATNENNLNSQQPINSNPAESFRTQALQLDNEGDSLSNQSKILYVKAKATDDKVEKRNLNMQAFNLQNESKSLHQQAADKRKEADQLNQPNSTNEIVTTKADTSNQNIEVVKSSDNNTNAKNSNNSIPAQPPVSMGNERLDTNNVDYPRYIQLVASAKEKQKATEAEFAKAVDLENQAKDENKQAQEKLDQVNKLKKKKEKQQATKDAKNLQSEAKLKQHDADSIYVLAKEMAKQSDNQKAEAITLREKLEIQDSADKSSSKINETESKNNTRTKQDISNSSSNNYVFSISNEKATKNEKRSIPHNEKLPDGLYFKVQIGAFKTPVSSDAFKGLQPITYEDGPNGWLRYTAGLFQTFESANLAKKEIRRIGYKDAFVVAYHNGKRISIYEAGLLIHDYTKPQKETYQFVYIEETKVLKANSIYPEKYAPELADVNLNVFNNAVKRSPVALVNDVNDSSKNTVASSLQNNIPTATTSSNQSSFNIKNTDGLFYTIQVGVYGTATPPRILESLKPLNTEVTPKGYYRFLSGLYNYFPPADAAKNQIARTLVPDAFVVAYYKGSRIGLVQARELEKTVTPTKFDVAPTSTNIQEPAPINTNTTTSNNDSAAIHTIAPIIKAPEEPISPSTIIFKVQLGAYREQVPFDVVDLFLKLSSKNITHYKDADGLTYYFAGEVHDYDTAVQLKNMVIAAGIKDAFVVAFSGDKKVPMEKVKKLVK